MGRVATSTLTRAAEVLSKALMEDAKRIRDEQGHAGHVAAQEREHLAMRISDVPGMVRR